MQRAWKGVDKCVVPHLRTYVALVGRPGPLYVREVRFLVREYKAHRTHAGRFPSSQKARSTHAIDFRGWWCA